MPNTAASYFSGSNSSNLAASGASGAAVNSAMAAPAFLNNAYASRIGGINSAGTLMSNALSRASSSWQNVTQGLGGATGALLNRAGGWDAIGGLFRKTMDTANYMPPGTRPGEGV